MREDLCHYLQTHADLICDELDDPIAVSAFLKKIVASQYMQVINHSAGIIRSLEWPLLHKGHSKYVEMQWAEGRWSDIQTMGHRCTFYVEAIKEVMTSLGMSLEDVGGARQGLNWADSSADFQYLLQQAKAAENRALSLNNAIAGLMGIVGNNEANREARRSLREAKNIKTLTLLAMVFIPLSFTSGLLSMGGAFIPGGDSFWVFFAVSIPIVVLLFLTVGLIRLGYHSDGEWSSRRFFESLKTLGTHSVYIGR